MDSVRVERLVYEDVKKMQHWGEYSDLRLLHYNFDYNTKEDFVRWYKSKRKLLRRYIYGIFLGDQLVGFITLKKINWIFRTAFFGISIDANYSNQKIGQQALKIFTEYVFEKFKMREIHLKVAAFNIRAQVVYKKMGFKIYKEAIEPYEEQSNLSDNRYRKYEGFFEKEGVIYTNYFYMKKERR